MLAFVRSLLVWLMVLALPHQGLAMSVMHHCAPVESPVRASVAPALSGHDHLHAAQHAGHDAAHAARAPEHLPADSTILAQGKYAEAAGTCSVCAACCPAIGMPPRLSSIPQAPGATPALQPPVVEVESFVPGGLDRPPRTLLA